MTTFFLVLRLIGAIALAFVALLALFWLSWIQSTWGMSKEEKEELMKYIEKNGILGVGDDDDHFPF